MENKKDEGFVPEVYIYTFSESHRTLYTGKGNFDNFYGFKETYLRIAEILINTKLPVECTFLVGFYFENDFSVGIEKIGDLIFEEDSLEIFQLDPNKVIINVKNELILFLSTRAGEFAKEAEVFQKKAVESNKQFSCLFSAVNRLITG